jgi:hypothetical protein
LIGSSSRDRAGVLSVEYDETDVEFFRFLRATIPANKALLIPTKDSHGVEGYRYRELLEYYLFPIEIVVCADPEACPEAGDGYILAVGGYPSSLWAGSRSTHTLEAFNANLGIFIPVASDGR